MDLDLSVPYLIAAGAVSLVGFVLFRYGKKEQRLPQLFLGVGLMVCPYFVTGTAWLYSITALVLAGLWGATRVGW